MKLMRITSTQDDFTRLTAELDMELNARYGRRQAAYDAHNKIDPMHTVLVGYLDEEPVACGCFKEIDHQTVEIKRMYVCKRHRRKGLSIALLKSLEVWGSELGYSRAILETGKGQPEAIGLYTRCGYTRIENYGPYKGMDNSVCMEKTL